MQPVRPYAGFGKRFYAYLIDQSIIQFIALVLMSPWIYSGYNRLMVGGLDQALADPALIEGYVTTVVPMIFMLQVVIGTLYGTWLEGGEMGATFGKRHCKIKVADLEGEGISYSAAFGRNLAINVVSGLVNVNFLWFLLLLIPCLTPLATAKRQTVYDMALKCVVVRTA
ncbi:MAG: RDD family protein [Alphaproteobacteria bacterium]|nr:RDD family protein [Alphaproteobacteria bacterium]